MSYAASVADGYRQAGIYVGRVTEGRRADRFTCSAAQQVRILINLKTAKALGLEVPLTLLARADEVIE